MAQEPPKNFENKHVVVSMRQADCGPSESGGNDHHDWHIFISNKHANPAHPRNVDVHVIDDGRISVHFNTDDSLRVYVDNTGDKPHQVVVAD